MDKKVVLAVAGSGKTTKIVDAIDSNARCLIFTYTQENVRNIQRKVLKKFDGKIPPGIRIVSYFDFLYSFCFRPAVGLTMKYRGIAYPDRIDRSGYTSNDDGYYKDPSNRVYHSRLAKLLIHRGHMAYVRERLEMFFDQVFVDEVQDFASHDFDFLLDMGKLRLPLTMVGDFHQHTYDTSRDGSKAQSLHDDFGAYQKQLRKAGFDIDTSSLSKSWRCSPAVCKFITDNLGIQIETLSNRSASVELVDSVEKADALWLRHDVVKLFLQEHYKYDCTSQNWGKSKGEDHYDEICIVLNAATLALYRRDRLGMMNQQTLKKFYVALSRSRGDVHLVPHTYYDARKGDGRGKSTG